jgi:hypothetical protein
MRNIVTIVYLLLCCQSASAQADSNREVAVIELGSAVNRTVKNPVWSFGPTIAVEITPIESWLELEAGFTPTFTSGSTELSTDLLFKKPWTLSRRIEFMAGVGPEWVHANERNERLVTNSVSVEAVLDFMFWTKGHRFGWYLEPDYEYNFGLGNEKSVGMSGGLLIAIRKHSTTKP